MASKQSVVVTQRRFKKSGNRSEAIGKEDWVWHELGRQLDVLVNLCTPASKSKDSHNQYQRKNADKDFRVDSPPNRTAAVITKQKGPNNKC